MRLGCVKMSKTYADWAKACNEQVSAEAKAVRKFLRKPVFLNFFPKYQKGIDFVLKSYEEKGFWGDIHWSNPIRNLRTMFK